jgi:hypothetical protein
MLTGQKDISVFIEKFNEKIQSTCKEKFKLPKSSTTSAKGRSVPWWTDAFTLMRKRTNALRRIFKRTLNNEELMESRKNQHIEGKMTYQAAIRKEKISSWKQHCYTTIPGNPLDEVYNLASGKHETR